VTGKKSKPSAFSVTDARNLLKSAEYLHGQTRPISHAEVSEALVPLGYDKSTIYRVLVELSESQLLTRIDAGDHAWRFEMRKPGDHSSSDHPHFVCNDCGKVECLPEVEVSLKDSTKKSKSGKNRSIEGIFLKGTCEDCI
jgi:Fur family transcriptional regulator, ferric uptake regulator